MVLALERAPRSGVYVLQEICEFTEDVDTTVLKHAWSLLAIRHPALRTSIVIGTGTELSQSVKEAPEISWQELDCAGLSGDETREKFTAFLRQDRELGFNLSEGVPVRFTLLRTSERSTTLIWTIHHALVDGRSLLVAWEEWFAIYDALILGEEAQLPRARSFHEHLEWLERQDFSRAADYWREYFDGMSQTTDYVVDRTLAARKPEHEGFAKHGVRLSAELTDDLRRFAIRHDVTVNNLIQAAWALLLSRYSNRPDVVFGVTRAGRPSPASDSEKGSMVGLLINTLPFRLTVTGETPVAAWLKQIRQRWTAQRDYQHTPLTKIWTWSGLPPGMPPFESVLVYEHEPAPETLRKLGGNWRHRTISRIQRTDSPLTLIAYGQPLLSLEIVYNTQLFSGLTIAGMIGHLRMLLISFVTQEGCSLAELKMLTEDEEKWLVHELNRRPASYPHLCAHQLFEQQVLHTPEKAALECAESSVSYDETNRKANRLARVLQTRGAGPEDVISVFLPRSPDAAIAILAVLKVGAAFLPLDPELPRLRIAQMLLDSGAKFVLTADPYLPNLSSCTGDVLSLDQLRDEVTGEADDNLSDLATPSNAAYAIYTSGSTGRPKAVVVPHRALVNHTYAAARAFGIQASDRRLQSGPIGTDVFVAEIFNYLSCGATLVFGLNQQGNSINEFLQVLEERRITITGIPSTWWNEWVAAMSEGDSALPSSLRAVIVGMERVDPGIFLKWKRLVGDRIRWFNAYGPTETSLTATIYEAGSSEWECGAFVPIGKPHPNTQAYVLDEHMNLAPMGVPGELYIGGEGVARGYLNAPELSAQRFLPDSLNGRTEGLLYRTGDLVFYLPDGNLVFLGRLDRQVKIRGFRVELEEIEGVLSRHPDVRQCAVVVNDQGSLVAYVSPVNGRVVESGDFRRHLSQYLPDHMVPAAIGTIDRMPLTPSGKIDRQSLLSFKPDRLSCGVEIQRPSTETEKRLALLWQQVLKVSSVGSTDNFFHLGGDSLSAVQLIMLIRNEFQKELPFATLLQRPTIARLGSFLDGGAGTAEDVSATPDPVIPLRKHGSQLPFFCVSSAATDAHCFRGIAKYLGDDQPVFALANPIEDGRRLQTVEELAERVCRSIQGTRSSGPYVLGGYCFGGVVAFEAARQLIAAGEEVRLVVLFDAVTPGYPKLLRNRTRYLQHLRQLLAPSGDNAPRIGFADIRAHLRFMARLVKKKAVLQTQRTVAQIKPELIAPPAPDLTTFMERSARTYRPTPIAAAISHFIAQQEAVSTRVIEDPRLGWRDLCTGEFQVYPIRAHHTTLFLEQQAEEIGEVLRMLLRSNR